MRWTRRCELIYLQRSGAVIILDGLRVGKRTGDGRFSADVMSRPKKDRIDTSPSSDPLNNALANLDVTGLPPGQAGPVMPPANKPAPSKFGRVVLRRETAHRGGKTVIVVHDFAPNISTAFIEDLSRRLRKAVGCGGTSRERIIEIQGDQPDRVRALLEAEGFRVAGVK